MAFTSWSFTRLHAIWWANSRTSCLRPRPVRVAAGVADVDEVLVRQQVDDGTGHGEPAEPAVEHPDRPIHHAQATQRLTNQAIVYATELVATWPIMVASTLPER